MVQQLQTGQHFLPFHRNSSCRLTQECGGGSVWATQTHCCFSSCEVDSSGQWKHTRHRQNSVGTDNYPTSFCSAHFCLCFVSSLSPQIASPPSVFLTVLIWTTCVSFSLLLFPASASPSTSSCVASLFSDLWTSLGCEFRSFPLCLNHWLIFVHQHDHNLISVLMLHQRPGGRGPGTLADFRARSMSLGVSWGIWFISCLGLFSGIF